VEEESKGVFPILEMQLNRSLQQSGYNQNTNPLRMTNNELTHQPEEIGLEFLHSKGKKNQNSFQIPKNHKGRKEGRKEEEKELQNTTNKNQRHYIRTKLKANTGQTKEQNKRKKKKKEQKVSSMNREEFWARERDFHFSNRAPKGSWETKAPKRSDGDEDLLPFSHSHSIELILPSSLTD
jgi:hypothetical protein